MADMSSSRFYFGPAPASPSQLGERPSYNIMLYKAIQLPFQEHIVVGEFMDCEEISDLLTVPQMEKVRRLRVMDGEYEAAHHLLACLKRKHGWFDHMLKALAIPRLKQQELIRVFMQAKEKVDKRWHAIRRSDVDGGSRSPTTTPIQGQPEAARSLTATSKQHPSQTHRKTPARSMSKPAPDDKYAYAKVEDPGLLRNSSWFHGCISRGAAVERLEGKDPGSFLVRRSRDHYTLSFRNKKGMVHMVIDEKADPSGRLFYGLGEYNAIRYSTIPELIKFYSCHPVRVTGDGQTGTCLSKPVTDEFSGVKCLGFHHSSDQPGNEDKMAISVDGSTNLTETANTQPAGSSQTQYVSLIHHKALYTASTEETKGESPGMVLRTDAAEGESHESDQNWSVDADFRCFYCSNDSSSSSQSTSDCESEVSASSSDAGLQSTEYLQSISVGSAGQSALVHDSDQGLHCPVFSPTWQAAWLFTHKGGTLRKPGSDVIMHVPPDAVKSDDGVLVHAAVCADVAWIRRILKVYEDEQVVSPLAEFWVGRDKFKFQRPVSVALPHWLPENADPDLVRVYHVTRSNNGHVDFTELNRRSQKTCTSGSKDATSCSELDMGEVGYFSLEEDQIIVFTYHFSGFVCTYCLKKGKTSYRPELYLTASGSISVPRDSPLARVDVNAHVWDKRIKVADLRQENGIAPGRLEHVELLTHFKGSKLELRMRSKRQLMYRRDADGELLHPGETKCFDLVAYFGCWKCAVEGRQLPKSHKWAMEYLPAKCLPSEEVAVDVLNLVDNASNPNQATTTLLFTIEPVPEQNSTTQLQSATTQTSANQTRSSTTQTDTDEFDRTLVKQRQLATTCFTDRLCDHTPLTGASSSSRQHLTSNGDATGATHFYVPANAARIEEPLVHQNDVVGLPSEPPPSASTNKTKQNNGQLESFQRALYQNCSITIHANTHNNNVNKMGKMNTGNTSTTHYSRPGETEAEMMEYEPQEVPQQGDIPVVEMPDDASLQQLQESRQDTSRTEVTEGRYPQHH